jgi:dTDP-L-rhamnose 4-epimerase
MEQLVLITGGAGFIGSHVADELLRRGFRVRALDVLHPQVHGADRARPAHLHRDVELVVGDVRDPEAVRRSLRGARAVLHLAARVGVGQSMYEIDEYVSANTRGTGVLLEACVEAKIDRLVVASSMSVYGEGTYRDADGRAVGRATRDRERLRRGVWDPCDAGGRPLVPVPTTEDKTPELESIYALTKYDQERMCLVAGRAYGIPTVALRFFNAYGPRQALGNPYTGVLAIFAARLLNGNRPLVFEDGRQMRDFVSVHDVARACRMALESPSADGEVLNVGSGRASSVREIAERMAKLVGKPHLQPEITGKHRMGDVRHCFADVTRARERIGWAPEVELERGLEELAAWLEGQVARDRATEARAELEARGLTL